MSIKKSVDKLVREENMRNEFDFSEVDESMDSSMIQSDKGKNNDQIKLHNINPSEADSFDGLNNNIKNKPKETTESQKQAHTNQF